ncbi:energy transducer TonB [Luteimonas sp. RD2P54]|uniref:Protein TonB n=1 Tax=Luteimonas endophytica TaxID=3042023 RepID=A0ABT6J704_9GAMM|nr:energy transducer TonB [Luteimonas endophytica]MDH5822601.1 energy transducer TonB [Luteimonas endophytica]
MVSTHEGRPRPHWYRLAVGAGLACALLACSRDEPEPAAPPAAEPAAPAVQQPPPAEVDQTAKMSVEELREAASKAYQESRLYSPAGDNAMEYYLRLRERQPGDAGVSSALTDLLPMTVIATEQSRDREDFEEARRLLALIQRADEEHPALQRLTASIDTAEESAAQRIAQQELTAEQEAQRQAQLEQERQRQQQQQQEQAARELAAQQEAEREAAAAEQQAAAQRAAEQRAAEQRAAEQRAAEQRAAQPAAAPTAADLRPISTPAPRYPVEALRSGQAGEVLVEFTIAPDGSVSNARVVRADPPRVFDREAVSAVRRWRFEPVGEPVTTRRSIAFTPGG